MTGKSNKKRAAVLMMAPFCLLFTLFILIPILASAGLSFTYFNMWNLPRFIGLENYRYMIADDTVFKTAIINTAVFAFITGPVSYFFSLIFAWMINDLRPKLRTFLTFLFYAPTLSGSVFFIWLYLFADDAYGFVNNTLMRLGMNEPIMWLSDPRYNKLVVIVVIIWMGFSTGFLSFIAGLQSVNRDYYEQGAIDGIRNRWQELWYITLPQMVPHMGFAWVMTVSASLAIGYQNMALTGFPSTDYSTHTILLHIIDYGSQRFEMGYASALALVLLGAMVAAMNLGNKLFARIGKE